MWPLGVNSFTKNSVDRGIESAVDRWQRRFDLMGFQRHLKAIGIFYPTRPE